MTEKQDKEDKRKAAKEEEEKDRKQALETQEHAATLAVKQQILHSEERIREDAAHQQATPDDEHIQSHGMPEQVQTTETRQTHKIEPTPTPQSQAEIDTPAPEVKKEKPKDVWAFDRQSFLKNLHSIPPDMVINIAEDGIVTEQEMGQLLVRMGFQEHHMEMMRKHFPVISHVIMRYAVRHLGVQFEKDGIYRMNGREAFAVMEAMLNKGLIERYYKSVIAPTAPASVLPELQFTREKDNKAR